MRLHPCACSTSPRKAGTAILTHLEKVGWVGWEIVNIEMPVCWEAKRLMAAVVITSTLCPVKRNLGVAPNMARASTFKTGLVGA